MAPPHSWQRGSDDEGEREAYARVCDDHDDVDDLFQIYEAMVEKGENLWDKGDVSSTARPAAVEVPQTMSPEQATALLAGVDWVDAPEVLLRLLQSRADPNVEDGQPLMMVFTLTPKADVATMRQHLLDYGATNTPDHQARWRLRKRTDANSQAWVAQAFEDPRVGWVG